MVRTPICAIFGLALLSSAAAQQYVISTFVGGGALPATPAPVTFGTIRSSGPAV